MRKSNLQKQNITLDILQINQVNKLYDQHQVLKDVSISIHEGTVFGLLGPNGAGKTTLIRLITGILKPDSGKIVYRGNLLQEKDINRFGYLPEERGLYKKMPVKEHLVYLARLKEISAKEAGKIADEMLAKFSLSDWKNKNIENLSKGMQQKVQFIATIIHKPDLVILDEPFSGFDPVNAILIKEEIFRLRQNGTTIIYSTHRMETVEEMCDKIAMINKAQIIMEGKPGEIRKSYHKNTYKLEARGMLENLSEKFTILDKGRTNTNSYTYTIKLSDDIGVNDLLSQVMNKTQIVSFSEDLPGMNDIFISKIKEQNE
ncbi:MAG: ABC transporter ATP-binding protein [Cytophagaceae bacterium]